MKSSLSQLLRSFFRRKPVTTKRSARPRLDVESLERRDMPAAISLAGSTIYIDGSAGNDVISIVRNQHGDNSPFNDTYDCSVTHNGITETKSFAVYMSTVNGPVQYIDNININGMGGSDTINDLTDLDFSVWQNKYDGGASDQAMMTFHKSTGEFYMKGTNAADTASFSYQLVGIKGTLTHGNQTLMVNKLGSSNGSPLITKLEFEGWDGDDNFENKTAIPVWAFGGKGKDTLKGGSGDDVLSGDGEHVNGAQSTDSGSDDTLIGGDGNDVLIGCGGNDMLFGGNGNDQLYGGNGNDLLDGMDGDDYLQGDNGNDQLFGGAGNDTMLGNAGNDMLWGGAGNDNLNGDGAVGEVGNDYLYGEAGDDTLSDPQGTNHLYGGDGNDQIFVSHETKFNKNTDINFVDGGAGNDYILSYGGTSYLHGGAGNDTLLGAQTGIAPGHDELYGDDGDDELLGGKWDTYMDGGKGTDLLIGGDGNDTLVGGDGNDVLIGGKGADNLDGGNGNDILIGGGCSNGCDGQADTLVGGAGNDIFYLEPGGKGLNGNKDWVTDFAPGDQQLFVINWGQFLTDNNFQKQPRKFRLQLSVRRAPCEC